MIEIEEDFSPAALPKIVEVAEGEKQDDQHAAKAVASTKESVAKEFTVSTKKSSSKASVNEKSAKKSAVKE